MPHSAKPSVPHGPSAISSLLPKAVVSAYKAISSTTDDRFAMFLRNRQATMLDIRNVMFGNAFRTFATLLAMWCILLVFFYLQPGIDIAVAHSFFNEVVCAAGTANAQVCGHFPYSSQELFKILREVLFYLPAAIAVALLALMLKSLGKQAAADVRRVREYGIAIISMLIGPYVLVNLVLKELSDRPRPADTTLFGGRMPFAPAGDFGGACISNCSFVSGEAAGAGWLACLVVLLPAHLRTVLGPPLIVIALIAPALRLSFGRHYLSDVTLGFLSSLVVYAAVTALFEMTQSVKKTPSAPGL